MHYLSIELLLKLVHQDKQFLVYSTDALQQSCHVTSYAIGMKL